MYERGKLEVDRDTSPFGDIEGTPIQPAGVEGIQASVEMFKEYCAGLKDLASEPNLEPLLLLRRRLYRRYIICS